MEQAIKSTRDYPLLRNNTCVYGWVARESRSASKCFMCSHAFLKARCTHTKVIAQVLSSKSSYGGFGINSFSLQPRTATSPFPWTVPSYCQRPPLLLIKRIEGKHLNAALDDNAIYFRLKCLFGIDFNSKLKLPIKRKLLFTLAPLPSHRLLHQGKSAFPSRGGRGGVSGPRATLWNTGSPVQVGAGGPGQLPTQGPSWFFRYHASPFCCIPPFLP